MTKDEIVEAFRELPFAEKCEVVMRIRHEFRESLGAEFIAKLNRTIARVCRNPERKKIWDSVHPELVGHGLLPAGSLK